MASNLSLSDTESSTGSSSAGENSNTIKNPPPPPPPRPTNTIKHPLPPPPPPPIPPPRPTQHTIRCFDCSCFFPTRTALIEHQRDKETCSQMRSNINRSFLNLIRQTRRRSIQSPQPPTIALPQQPPRANPTTSRLALAPSPSSFRHNNAAGNGIGWAGYLKRYHPYLRQENMPICPDPRGGGVDRGFSPEKRTLDLISQLDPTLNLLSQLERQPARHSINGANVAYAAPGTSKGKGILDLNLKL